MSSQKTIFITGTSSGLGRASVELFSARGWRVIATMRGSDAQKGTELSEFRDVTVLPLDVTDSAQIKDAAAKAVAISGVDVVFNNADYGMAGPYIPLHHLWHNQQIADVKTSASYPRY